MQSRPGTYERAGHALAAALCCAALALGAHLGGGGSAPGPSGLLLALVGPALIGGWAGSVPWSTPRLTAALATGQALAHLALSAGMAPEGAGMAPEDAGMHSDIGMLAWHVLGTAVAALLLTRSDRVVAWLLDGVTALAAVLRTWPGTTTTALRVRGGFCPRTHLHGLLLARTLAGRGPPLQPAS